VLTKTYDFGAAGTHLGGGVMSTFVFRQLSLLKHPALLFVGSTALRKGPQRRFWLHCHNYLYIYMPKLSMVGKLWAP